MTPSKRRRHEMALWWMPHPVLPAALHPTHEPNNKGSNEKDVLIMDEKERELKVIHSLKEGENWLMVQNEISVTSGDVEPMKITIVHDPSLYFFLDGRNENAKNEGGMEIDHKRDQHHDHSKNCLSQSLPVLCIDVDTTAQCIAVKDIRRGQSETVETNNDQTNDDNNNDNDKLNNNLNVVDRLKFSLVRRKRKDKKTKMNDNMNHAHREPVQLTEQGRLAGASDDDHSSGYNTDDEKDIFEDSEEGKSSTNNRDNGTQIENGLPAEETDVDSDGNSLYETPECLPPRQLRVLRDGDRLVMRYTPCSMTNDKTSTNCDAQPYSQRIAKLEYINARKTNSHPPFSRSSQHHRMKEMKGKLIEAATGKPRLLSVKSDVKSECKKKFTLNSTSAAEAPSDDDVSIKATNDDEHQNQRKREHNGNTRADRGGGAVHDYFWKKNYEMHKAGKDWSAAESDRVDAIGARGGGNKDKNANRNNDEDDGMEEYSYLTGEIVMKDQDYISALTGDEAIAPPPRQSLNHNEGLRSKTEHDAAAAINVVMGAFSSPAGKNKRDCQLKEVSFDAKCRTPEKAPPVELTGKADYVKPGEKQNVQKSKEIYYGAHNETLQTALSDHKDMPGPSPEEELELLSQADAVSSTGKGAINYDDVTDVSQTQSLPFIKTTIDNTDVCSQSLSDVEEGKEDDDYTTGPYSPNKKDGSDIENAILPSHVEVRNANRALNQHGDNHFSQSTTVSPKLNSQYDDEAYNAETQFAEAPSPPALSYHSDHEIYNAETQFVGPAIVSNFHFSREAKINDDTGAEVVMHVAEQSLKSADVQLNSENITDLKLSHEVNDLVNESTVKEVMTPAESPRTNRDTGIIERSPGTKPSSPRRATYDHSRLLGDDAIHRIPNGAIMTRSVGGTNLGLSVAQGHTDRDLLTSIALQSTPNTLPEAPMSSEETTVVNEQDTKETTVTDHLPSNSGGTCRGTKAQKNSSLLKSDSPPLREFAPNVPVKHNKDSHHTQTIPAEVCFAEKKKKDNNIRKTSRTSFTLPRHRSKRICEEDSKQSTSNDEKIRIMFTGIEISSKHRKMIQSIGAEVVDLLEQAASATHVIASDGKAKLRRTPKLMICICKTSNILSIDWLEQSASQHKILNPKDFLVLGDKAAEAAYNFSMKETLENGEEARRNGGVLGGYFVYICNGVADNNAPPFQALHLIIEAAGGQVLKALTRRCNPLNTIILTSHPSTNAQLSEKGVERAASQGAKIRTTSWLFHTIITQRFSFDVGFSNSPLEQPKPRAKRNIETTSPSSSTKRRR